MNKCKICGKVFKLKSENRYQIVKNPKGLKCLTEDPVVYECFDCPSCGCQNVVNIREVGDEYEDNSKEQHSSSESDREDTKLLQDETDSE